MTLNLNNLISTLETSTGTYRYVSIVNIGQDISHLPFSLRILLENLLRHINREEVDETHAKSLLNWPSGSQNPAAIPFFPGRVLLQDFTGVPVINDLAAMRSAMLRLGGDPARINPLIPVDMVVDHSLQVDQYKSSDAWKINAQIELERNRERYEFLRWGQKSFNNFNIIPPASGIIHQVNLEFLSRMVLTREESQGTLVFPDTLVGTDSHTTMINGLGVLGWGVGGIEAVAAMLNQPLEIQIPDVKKAAVM
jgi:aconitate hydratase